MDEKFEGNDEKDTSTDEKHSSSSSASSRDSTCAEAKDNGAEEMSHAELEQLFYAVEMLSGTLLEDIMPQDDPPEDVLEGGPLAAKAWEYTYSILGEFSAASIDAGVSGDDAVDAARGAFGWSLRHSDLHKGFVDVVEGFLTEILERDYNLSLSQFIDGCTRALELEERDGGDGSIRRFAKAGTLELLDLIQDVQRFESWANGMKKLAFENEGARSIANTSRDRESGQGPASHK